MPSDGLDGRSLSSSWRSLEELVQFLESESIVWTLRPHPERPVEPLQPAVDLTRTVNSKNVNSSLAPRTFYFGHGRERCCANASTRQRMSTWATRLTTASSGLSYIVNPPGTLARVHQHLNIGQGEGPWHHFFCTLTEIVDVVMTACVSLRKQDRRIRPVSCA